jgi:hypothetical protein
VIILVFGTSTDTLRLFSALCGAVCVPFAYVLGLLLVGRRCGHICAALTAVTLPLIYWSQQIRGYSFVVALLTLSAIMLTKAMQDGSRVWFICFSIVAILACYTELFAAIVVVAQFLTLMISSNFRARLRRLIFSGVFVAAAAGVPLLLMATARGSKQLFWLGPPGAKQVRETVAFLASSRVNTVTTSTTHLLTEITVILVCIAIVVGLVQAIILRNSESARTVLLGATWLCLPIALSFWISTNYSSVFLDRYFLITIPALTLLVGYLLSVIPYAPVCWVGCAAIIGLRAEHFGSTYNVNIDNWRTATTMVVNDAEPGACVAFYFNDGFVDFAYYLEHPPQAMHANVTIPRSILPALSFGSHLRDINIGHYPAIVESYDALSPREITSQAKSCTQLFLISNHDGHNSNTSGSQEVWRRFVAMRTGLGSAFGEMHTTNLGSITIYQFEHQTSVTTTQGSAS